MVGERPPSRIGDLCQALADVLFPPLCYSCGALLPPRQRIVCAACVDAMPLIDTAELLYVRARERLCADGMVDDFLPLYRFEKGGGLQALLHELKYGGALGVGVWLGEQLGIAFRGSILERHLDAIVPVPLHIVKKRERGYNQTVQVAKGMGDIVGMAVAPDAVRRIRYTPSQTALGVAERKANVEGAFEVPRKHRDEIRGRRLLLVDDLVTTGATLRACGTALRFAGAGYVLACSVGLADRTGVQGAGLLDNERPPC